MGVAAVPQELPVVPDLSVTENIFLGMLPSSAGLIKLNQARAEARRVLAHLHAGAEVPELDQPVKDLELAGQQLVTVARALVRHAGVIVFDEPTSALPGPAAARLRDVIRTLRADGEAILFISQRLTDVLDIADEVTVLRDGRAVTHGPADSFTADALVHWMVHGQPPTTVADHKKPELIATPRGVASRAVLSVRDLYAGKLRDVSLDVAAGELVGLFGLPGSGAGDILEAIYGADPAASGSITIEGHRLTGGSVRRRIERGVAYVTGDRGKALVADLSVAANMALPGSRRVGRPVSPARERRTAAQQIKALNIQPPDPDVLVSTLSGGNQQKVILARWLTPISKRGGTGDPKVWLLDDPTRGVDAQAQADIHQIIRDRVQAGACGLIYSADPRELHQICDRGLLVEGGRITAEIDPRQLDADELGRLLEGNRV
jgi:ABC-type sugar transport system ATPase subunit